MLAQHLCLDPTQMQAEGAREVKTKMKRVEKGTGA